MLGFVAMLALWQSSWHMVIARLICMRRRAGVLIVVMSGLVLGVMSDADAEPRRTERIRSFMVMVDLLVLLGSHSVRSVY